MKNPKLLFATNILIILYLGLISFYMFNDFLMFEQRHHHNHGAMEPTSGQNTTTNSTSQSMVIESAQY